jgi:AraC-like DNA-binding protein
MPRRPKAHAAPSRVVPRVLRYVRERGGDVGAVLWRARLPREIEHEPEAAISPEGFEELMDAASAALGDGCLAIHLVEALDWPSYSIPELAARASPTLGEALSRVARYASLFYAHLLFSSEEDEARDELVLRQRVRGVDATLLRHSSEYALASALHHARHLVARPIAAARVAFAHAPSSDLGELRRFFGTSDVAFGVEENLLVLSRRVTEMQTRTADPRLLTTADALAESALGERPRSSDFVATVADRIGRELEAGDAQASGVAKSLRMSQRTLQRRLAEDGTSFTKVRERVRRERGVAWVRSGSLPLAEIAYRLGFSDPAAFSRAFKRWTGHAPGAYRERIE